MRTSFEADGRRTWGEQFDFLQGTWAAECPFRRLKVAFCSAVSDQVGKDKKLRYSSNIESEEDHPWKSKVHSEVFTDELGGVLETDTYCHPGPQSASSDACLRLSCDRFSMNLLLDIILALACKMVSAGQSWAVLRDEVNKAGLYVKAGFRVVLVFVVTNYSMEIMRAFGDNNYLVLGEGQYVYKHLARSLVMLQTMKLHIDGLSQCVYIGNFS